MKKFIEKHIDVKRLKTGLLQSLIIGIFILLWNNGSYISNYLKFHLWPWITYEVSIPLIPALLVLLMAQVFAYKILNKFQIKFGKVRTIEISDWVAKTNRSNAQWTDYFEVALNGRIFQEIQCKVKSSSPYFRFGFKLLSGTSSTFNSQGGLLNFDDNALIHVGRTAENLNVATIPLAFNSYLNGNRREDKILLQNLKDDMFLVKLSIDTNNILYFYVNNVEYHRLNINGNLRERLILMAWGDGHEYDIEVSDIVIKVLK